MAVDRTSRSNRRVRRRLGTALSNVRPVRHRRRCCTRRPSVVVVDSPSLGTTPRNIDMVRGSITSSLSISRVGVGDDVHGGRQRVTEMQLYAQVTLLYQMEAGTIALIRVQVKTEEGVAVPEVAASQTVPLVLPNLAGRGE